MKWYACYTKPRAEKTSSARLERAGIECYLPLKRERRKWSDRLKTVSVPLFPSYIFVHIDDHQFNKVRIEGDLVGFITFEGKAAAIPDEQIDAVRRIIAQETVLEIAPPDMKPGQKIEITGGPLIGIKGELVSHKGNHNVLVRLAEVGQGLLFTVDKEFVSSRI